MTNYKDIIAHNAETYCRNRAWWAFNAFHYTDISNAINILKTGYLYSRMQCSVQNLMLNDNASRQVIDMTNPAIIDYARFYFRPLTPTQYNNEGYKHPLLRYNGDIYANVPIPVFFVFDLQTLLSDEKTCFSGKSQAGYVTPSLSNDIEDFKKFDFARIYSVGKMDNIEEDKKYRQAEILYPTKYPIQNSLRLILCRNEIERATLLKGLKSDSICYATYKDIVKIGKEFLFENNGFNVSEINYYNGKLELIFNDVYNRLHYALHKMSQEDIDRLYPLQCELVLRWKGLKDRLIDEKRINCEIDYLQTGRIILNLPDYKYAKFLEVKFCVLNDIMCDVDVALDENQIF